LNKLVFTFFTSYTFALATQSRLKMNGAIDVAAEAYAKLRNMRINFTHHLVILEEFGYTDQEWISTWARAIICGKSGRSV